MKKIIILLSFILMLTASFVQAQATLEIYNKSQRSMEIKVMEQGYQTSEVFRTVSLSAGETRIIKFYSTGNFYLKTKAELRGKDPICEKGKPFKVYVGYDGYSVLKITYTIVESANFNPLDGKRISLTEYEKDN